MAVSEALLLAQAVDLHASGLLGVYDECVRPQRPQQVSKTGLRQWAQNRPFPPQGAKNVLKLKEH